MGANRDAEYLTPPSPRVGTNSGADFGKKVPVSRAGQVSRKGTGTLLFRSENFRRRDDPTKRALGKSGCSQPLYYTLCPAFMIDETYFDAGPDRNQVADRGDWHDA